MLTMLQLIHGAQTLTRRRERCPQFHHGELERVSSLHEGENVAVQVFMVSWPVMERRRMKSGRHPKQFKFDRFRLASG